MKQISTVVIVLHFLLCVTAYHKTQAQSASCIFKPPVFEMDFGNANVEKEINQSALVNYRKIDDNCPNDGYFSIVSNTSDCYGGNWITLSQDHTANDAGGKMMLVNAAFPPGTFFVTAINGLAPNTTYELAVWLVNVCSSCNNDIPISPQLSFIIENTSGKQLINFATGELKPTGTATWLRHAGLFTTPSDVGTLVLRMTDKVRGGCGNDFAMDDITIRECILPKPLINDVPKLVPALKPPPPPAKPVAKKTQPVSTPEKKDLPAITKIPPKDIEVISIPAVKGKPSISVPSFILTRANPIIKKIETANAEIVIDLYDNGEIDGDTVSIYHNNVLVVSRAGLSAKPVTFHFAVDAMHPHHELVMVANNLGSIPPNTSLMIVTAGNKRYEIFISSSEQKNAKVVIDLEE